MTLTNDFFQSSPNSTDWRLEVLYSSLSDVQNTTFDFQLNHPPQDGFCSIHPSSGTMMTLFTIDCSNWHDRDQIKDLIFYGMNPSKKMMLGHSTQSISQLYLPASIDPTSSLFITVHIRDALDCVAQFTLSSVIVFADVSVIDQWIENIRTSNASLSVLGQIAYVFNELNEQSIRNLVGISLDRIFVSSLDDATSNFIPMNSTTNLDFDTELNKHSRIREEFILLITQFPIQTPEDLKFHASLLSTFTESPNQLTRKASVRSPRRYLSIHSMH